MQADTHITLNQGPSPSMVSRLSLATVLNVRRGELEMEKVDHPTTTGSAGTDRDVRNEPSLDDQLIDLQRQLELEKAKNEAIHGLMSGYQITAPLPQSTTTQRSTLDLIGSIPWDKPKAFLAFFAIVLFGAVRFANGAFYARLGLTPEDVGLNSAVILARSAMSAVLLVTSLILLGSFGFTLQRNSRWWPLGFLTALLGVILFRTLFPPPSFVITGRDEILYNGAIYLGGVFLGWLVALQDELLQRRRDSPEETNPSSLQHTRNSRADATPQAATDAMSARTRVIIVELALAATILFGLAGVLGYSSAARVMDGELLRCGCVAVAGRNVSLPWLSGTPGFLAVRVQHAEVVWNTPPKKPPEWARLPMEVMYLGQADGMFAVYDPNSDRPLRFPIGAVLIRVDPRPATFDESSYEGA